MNSHEVLERWAGRSGEYSPAYYAYYGPDETSELIRARLDAAVGPDAAVLELGCSSGRHLAHLHEAGYGDLHGIDVNENALDVMAEEYPALADAGTFRLDAIENVVPEFPDDRFDAVYSVETLQHVHPDHDWVFGDLARITEYLVTAEIESEVAPRASGEVDRSRFEDVDVKYVSDEFPLYYRNWGEVLPEYGFVEVASESAGRDTIRSFRRAEE